MGFCYIVLIFIIEVGLDVYFAGVSDHGYYNNETFQEKYCYGSQCYFFGGFLGVWWGFGVGDDFWGWCYGGWGDNEMILLNLIVCNTITRYIHNSDSNSRSTDNLA